MNKKLFKNNEINLKSIEDYFYLEKNNIILDKTCPGCKKLIIKKKDFCECGFFIKARENSILWSAVFSVWLSIGIFFLAGLINFEDIKNHCLDGLNKKNMDFNTLSPINIQIITSLKNSTYNEYIQNIYVKPKEKNKLMILIKPNLWNILSSQEKNELLAQINKNWEVLYKQKYPLSKEKPEVNYSN